MLPMLLRLKIRDENTSFGLFIPLIIIYILLLPAYIICGIVYALIAASGNAASNAGIYMKIVFRLPQILAAARGTEIIAHSDKSNVTLYLR